MINTARHIGSLSTRSSRRIITPLVRENATCCSKYHTARTRLLSPSSLRWARMTTSSKSKPQQQPQLSVAAAAKTSSGSGKAPNATQIPYIKDRGPVSWPSLFLVGIAATSIVAYYNIERERRLESAMGRVVSSESEGWTPNPDSMAPRKFKLTPWGWFPEDDGFGPCKKERETMTATTTSFSFVFLCVICSFQYSSSVVLFASILQCFILFNCHAHSFSSNIFHFYSVITSWQTSNRWPLVINRSGWKISYKRIISREMVVALFWICSLS